ncbi:MAG: BACON domain-containing protein, partial [Verrucomicrobia bacterium]|nr:BACON domain-containing protein [Verrucomicrobiota bacterium]
ASPFLRISPEEAAFRTEGGPLEIEVTSNIRWIAQRNVGWLTPLNPGFQEGDAIALFTVEPNLSVGPRVGRVSIEDKILIVRQDGIPAEFAISPLEQVFSSDGGEALVDVTANTEWTATPTINWIFFPQGMTFQGDARLSYRIHNNPDPWPRTGYLYIGDQEHVIRQAGNVPSLRIYPEAAANFGSAGGAGEFTVECRDTVIWWPIADVPWISMLGEYPLQGGGFARYLVAVNPSTESRTGRILVGNTIHRVSQSGAAPLLEIAPLESNFPATGGNGVIQVVANSTWSAASLQDWILLAPESSGSGNGEVRYAVLAHTTSDTRTGTISINHIDHRVTQTGVASPPAVTQFQINNGEASTTDRAVVLSSQCSGSPGEFAASEDPFLLVDEVVWRPYTPSVEFTLSEGAGVKTVYFKVRNAVGESGVSSASIYYQPVYDGLYLGRWSIEHGGKDRSSELLLYVTIEGVLRARRMPGVYHDIPDDCAVEKPGASVVIPWFSMPGVYFERYELTVESPTKMTGLLRRPVFLFEPEEEVFPIVCTHIPPKP